VPEDVKLTASDNELLQNVIQFAIRQMGPKHDGIYMGQFYHRSASLPAVVIVAVGEQAVAVQQILADAANQASEGAIIQAANERGF
jgi:hypothetical protein